MEPRTEAARRRLGGTGGGYPRESGTSPGLGIQIHDESRLVGSVACCLAMISTRTPASSSWPSAKCLDFPTSAESRESGRCREKARGGRAEPQSKRGGERVGVAILLRGHLLRRPGLALGSCPPGSAGSKASQAPPEAPPTGQTRSSAWQRAARTLAQLPSGVERRNLPAPKSPVSRGGPPWPLPPSVPLRPRARVLVASGK